MRVNSSLEFEGLFDAVAVCATLALAGFPRGEPEEAAFVRAALTGEGTLGSLACVAWPGRARGAVLLGEACVGFGVTPFNLAPSDGLAASADA
jgi:hypothetical protein